MPEKLRQRRVQIARRQGKATAVKSADVGMAGGLSRHAAKKSRHVQGMRTPIGRSVSRKMPPGAGKSMGRGEQREGGERAGGGGERPLGAGPRVAGIERRRSQQKILSRRSRSGLAAKQQRQRS